MQARVAGVTAEFFQFLTLNDDPIPEGAYDQGDYAAFIRNGEGGWAALTFFSGDLVGAGGGSPFVIAEATEDSTATYLILDPVAGKPSATGENTLFLAKAPFDRPAEGGIIGKVLGVNDAEPFQFQTLDGDQIPVGAWVEDDWLLFMRPEGIHFKLLTVFKADLGAGDTRTPFDRIAEVNAGRNAARADRRARRTRSDVAALGEEIAPAAFDGDDLTLDFANGFYRLMGERHHALRAAQGFSYARTGAKGEFATDRVVFQQANVPAILAGVGYYARNAVTNLLLNSAFLATQNVTVTAVEHTLSFIGTGSITLTGAHAAVLAGTGAKNRVSLTFTPAAGTLTVTVAGSVRLATLATGSLRGPIIISAGAQATVGADTLQVSYSLDDEPFFLFAKVDLKLAGFTARLLVLNEANSSNLIRFERLATGQLRVTPVVGGVAQAIGQIPAHLLDTVGTVVLGVRRDAAGKFSEAARHVNGTVVVAAPGAAAPMPPGMTRLDIGNHFGSDQPRSPIALVRCIRGDLTDAEITALLEAA
jgi:hypothetical protein